MTTEIRLAEGDAEHREAHALRARVFVGEKILDRGADDDLFLDVFDPVACYQTIVAIKDGAIIGTVRARLHGDQRTVGNDFDLPPAALPADAVVGSGSMLCVEPAHRESNVGLRLIEFATKLLHEQGANHGIAPIRPQAEPIFQRLGWYRFAPPFIDSTEGVPVVPMAIDLATAAHLTPSG